MAWVGSGSYGGRLDEVKRLVVSLLAVLMMVAGCGRQAPEVSSTPSASASAREVVIGTTPDETTGVLAELYRQGLAGKDRAARIVELTDDPNIVVSRIEAGEVDLAPAFAWTAAQGLQVDSSDPDTLVADLAAALDGEVAVLQQSEVDRSWRYVSGEKGASLDDLPKGVTIVAPTRWKEAGDGLSGLEAVYHAKPTVTTVDDSDDRLAQVTSGSLGVFEATDPNVVDLEPVADPLSMVSADPLVAFLRIELASDDTILDVVQQLHEKLDNGAIIDIRRRAKTVGVTTAVTEWLQANPLT